MVTIRKSIFIVFVEKYSTLLISFMGIMLISRLLTPKEIGIFSVASAVSGIAQMLRDFGVSAYLVQECELTKDKIRTALTITILTSWTAGILLFLPRYWIADFYQEPGLIDLIAIQCINFIIIPFTGPIIALLRRDMQFGVLFRVNLMSTIVSVVTSLSLAASGFGYLSLAWSSVASIVCTALLVNANRPKDAFVLPSLKEWRPIFKFGTQTSVTSIITQISVNLNDLILGRLLGFQSVATYSRAQGLMYLFHRDMMDAVRQVAFPAFSQAVRENSNLLNAYLLSVNYVTVFAWPFYAFLGLFAQPIMHLMFGDQWDAAIPLVRILVFAGAIAALWNLATNTLMSLGLVNKILRSELIVQSVRVLLVLYAASISVEMVCYALIMIYIFNLFITLIFLKQAINLKLFKLLLNNANSLIVCITSMMIPTTFFLYLSEKINQIELVIISGLGCILGWLMGVYLTKHPIYYEITRLIRKQTKETI